MLKGRTLKQKRNGKRRNLETSRRKIGQQKVKVRVNTIDFASPVEFSQLCLTVEAKITTLSDVVLNIYKGNIQDYNIISEGEYKDLTRGKVYLSR